MSEFVILEGKKKYQDFWMNMRNATQENFQTDLAILLKEQENLDKRLERVQAEKDRLFKLVQRLSSECQEQDVNAPGGKE